ncbi:MAG: choice-of-anchor D domain-containing protein, partial [Myxococcales bacterium]
VLRNVGRAPMVLASAEPAEGATEHFSLPVRRTELGIGGELPLTVSFAPRDEGDLAATFLLRFNDASTESVLVRVSGRGVKGRCVVEPGELVNFGTVATGDAWTTQVRIRNETTLGWSVNVGAITSDTDPGAFTFEDFVPGEHAVEAGGELAIPVTFRPNHLGQHDAFLTLPAPSMCQPAVLRLQGVGVDQVLTWEPRALDFGFVNPGTRVTRELTFTNAGNLPVRVSDLLLADRTGKFELEAGTPAELEIAAAGGQARVTLAFKPATLGAHTTTLAFKTDAARLPTGNATLRGYGGGPDIDVSPTRLAFGAVGVGTHQLRRVTVANTGSDAPATTEDNLKLRAVWHEWEPATGHGFTAQLDGYPTEGLRAGASADVRVRFAPTGFGVQEAKLRIFSNDPDEPVVEVEVRGEGADVPPCDYEVVPPAVRF